MSAMFDGTGIITLITGIIVIVFFWKNWKSKKSTDLLPPGPSPLPLIGNLLTLDVKEPYRCFLELSEKYGSVFMVWLGRTPVVVISGYQAIKEAFVEQAEDFHGRATYPLLLNVTRGYGLLVSSGERWKQLRRFSITTLKNFGMGRSSIEEKIHEEANFLIQSFSKRGDSAFNPKDFITSAVFNVICSIVFGKRYDYSDPDFKFLSDAVDKYFYFLSSGKGQLYNTFPTIFKFLPGPHHQVLQILEKVKEYIQNKAEECRKTLDVDSPRHFIEAFVIQMIKENNKAGSEFHKDNLQATVWNLFSAGTETTSSTLRQSLLLMMKYPKVQERVQKEISKVIGTSKIPSYQDRQQMPYTDAVIHEVQRSMDLSPTAVPHKVLKDTDFKGFCIPEGTMVLPLLSSVLSDKKLWKNPTSFDPENFLDENQSFRKNDAFLPFGLGKRVCLGEGLARMELFIFFTALLQRFTFVATEPPEDINTSPACSSFGRLPRLYMCYAKPRG